jgi:hypothetical protein
MGDRTLDELHEK